MDAETLRLNEEEARKANWKRWGPYLSERQWSTVREDYSPDGTCWDYFPHDHARSRAYRWGEDGLLGFTDRQCRLCFALALWNGRDTILKERLFGLTGQQGNHGEDVKEHYFYLDSTPTHSYARALYKYPIAAYPYQDLVDTNAQRSRDEPEYELEDTGVFEKERYFDVFAEYAKGSPDDILIRITIVNRSSARAPLWFLPTLWFRNTWSWGCTHEGCSAKPGIRPSSSPSKPQVLDTRHETLGQFQFGIDPANSTTTPELLFTDNETNYERLYGTDEGAPYTKDAFHQYVIDKKPEAVNPKNLGTKAAPLYQVQIPAGKERVFQFRLRPSSLAEQPWFGEEFNQTFTQRREEAAQFFSNHIPSSVTADEHNVLTQAYAGLLWTKQFYHFVVADWLNGDPGMPSPPEGRKQGRNHRWTHLFNRDVISMPDKWEYPWFAAWDLAFHMIPFATIDGHFAKQQLSLFLREWYMHPNGQIPAYEFAFGDVNPPVHAWAVWRVYKIADPQGQRDRGFLESAFQKLLINFTWWVNRKDENGDNLFSGGFLGLDNIGVFDRSKPLPTGGTLQQADGTAWMAFYCATMLAIALELAKDGDKVVVAYEDMASKFLEHFVQIAAAINQFGETGLWDEKDKFYYDSIKIGNRSLRLKTRSMVGLLPLIAVEVLEEAHIQSLPGFYRRLQWFLDHNPHLSEHITKPSDRKPLRLLSIVTKRRLTPLLNYILDEQEFLSPFGIRSLSKYHQAHPFIFNAHGSRHQVDYVPGESNTWLFGGNSNWRGPIWFPVNYLLIEALEKYDHYYGDKIRVPKRSPYNNLAEVVTDLHQRLASLFLRRNTGQRPCMGESIAFQSEDAWKDLLLFHEYFHAETGRGLGASHQTGWTALVIRSITDLYKDQINRSRP